MTKAELISEVKSVLGSDEVDLEIKDETIGLFIDKAVRQAFNYMDYRCIRTLPVVDQKVDVSELNVGTVLNIYETQPTNSLSEFELYIRQAMYSGSLVDYMGYNIMRSNYDSIISRGFRLIGNTLYVDNYYSYITLEWMPKSITFEEVTEPEWIEWISKYTIALTKEAIGRVRSKYSVTGSPFELDGEKLLEEGKAEQLECLDYLANKPVFTILK
jgi:hypothetical protein